MPSFTIQLITINKINAETEIELPIGVTVVVYGHTVKQGIVQ